MNLPKTLHLLLGSLLFYLLSFLTIYAASYAILAGVNFGVIASCISLSTPFNCLFSYVLYGEQLTKKMIVGTAVLFAGILIVSMSKGGSRGASNEVNERYRIIAIGIALVIGFLNAVRTAHGKHVFKRFKYAPVE